MKLIKQEHYRRSVRSFFNTKLSGTSVFLTEDESDEDEWIRIKFGNSDPGLVSETAISLYACTSNDDDYLKLAGLVDKITEYVQEGLYIPYEEPIELAPYWKTVMNMRMATVTMSDDMNGPSDTKVKIIEVSLITINA